MQLSTVLGRFGRVTGYLGERATGGHRRKAGRNEHGTWLTQTMRPDREFGELAIKCGMGILSQRPEMSTFAAPDPPNP